MYIALDIGGTTTRVSFSKNFKTLGSKFSFATPQKFSDGLAAISDVISVNAPGPITAIMIAVAGIIDHQKNKIIRSPNLQDWENKPLVAGLRKKFKAPVFIENDAAIAGLGEAVFGAGRRHQIVAYLTLGTGIGGARIVNKQIDLSSQGFEPGYHIVELNGRSAPHGQRGVFEVYASGHAYKKNPLPWPKYSERLGQGVVNAIVFWSPQIVVLGGGFSVDHGPDFLNYVKKFVAANLLFPKIPPIVVAQLGNEAALYGGLHYLKSK